MEEEHEKPRHEAKVWQFFLNSFKKDCLKATVVKPAERDAKNLISLMPFEDLAR